MKISLISITSVLRYYSITMGASPVLAVIFYSTYKAFPILSSVDFALVMVRFWLVIT